MMKQAIILFLAVLFSFAAKAQDEEITKIPTNLTVYDTDGNAKPLSEVLDHDGLTIIDFWASWCRPCHYELQELNEKHEEWNAETGVKMVLISIDKEDKRFKIPILTEKYGWKGESYIDNTFEVKNALGVDQIPNVFLVDKEGNVLYHSLGYSSKGTKKLYKTIKKNGK